jgi:chlorosome envelope protein I
MPTVIINNTEYEGQVGERLIDVARRNGAHIGFICDGLGVCQACACRVLRGSEHLSPPSGVEENWFQPSWLEAGHRLACQTLIRANGTIETLSRAEELRRQTIGVFMPPEGTSTGQNMGHLADNMSRIVMNQVVRFPSNAIGAAKIATRARPTPQTIQKLLGDTTRVVQRMIGGESAVVPAQPPTSQE